MPKDYTEVNYGSQRNTQLSSDKCEFSQCSITFLGHLLNPNGIQRIQKRPGQSRKSNH